MVTVEDAVVARIDRSGKHFEILVDPETAYALREGKSVSVQNMLAINQVYTDSKKGMKASDADVEEAFGTRDVLEVAEAIVRKGDVQLTTEFRKKKVEERTKQIANFISRNAINPQTKAPHPAERILNAMEQAHVNVDPARGAEDQVDGVVDAIKEIVPISIEKVTMKIEVPAAQASKAYGVLEELGAKQDWLPDGTLVATLEVPAGTRDRVYRKVNAASDGEAKIEEK